MEQITNKLYVISTPIGNLDELSARALYILNNVDFIACEDTRNTVRLCSHFNIQTPLLSCHEHNELYESDKLINLIKEGHSLGLVSDAGYPGISDPGSLVIKKCIENNIDLEVISGPCALINGLVGSGLDTTHFYFHGFLPHKLSDKKKELKELVDKKETMIFYEAPHRIDETLEAMLEILGDRNISIARELTKKFEEFIRDNISSILARIKDNPLIGELVVVVNGNTNELKEEMNEEDIIKKIDELVDKGLSAKDAIKEVSSSLKIAKNEVYKIYHK